MLRIDFESGDLSRRQITYNLPGLSFREYLYFEDIVLAIDDVEVGRGNRIPLWMFGLLY